MIPAADRPMLAIVNHSRRATAARGAVRPSGRASALDLAPAELELAWLEAPPALGPIFVALRNRRLCALGFAQQEVALRRVLARRFGDAAASAEAARAAGSTGARPVAAALARWFGGDLRALDSLETDSGGTPFQQRVWAALRTIPPAETRSYAWLAAALGDPAAVRAVGTANGRNPISLVVPCHRVIGKDGALAGYAGGIARKQWLIDFERRHR